MEVSDVISALPINKLIEAVSGAIGKTYEPRHIRKMADAKAYEIKVISEQLRNNSDVPIVYDTTGIAMDTSNFEEIAKRASSRLAYQEISKQENIEAVVDNAYTELEGKNLESEENIDRDWMLRFINSIEDISNEKMQMLWGKILAGEILRPKSFSLRTLDVLRNLSQNEAKLFEKVCNYVISDSYIYNDNDILNKYGVSYREILTLDECGLINSSGMISSNIPIHGDRNIIFVTDDYVVLGKTEEKDINLEIQQFLLSEAGKGLYRIVNKKLSKNYVFDIVNSIKEKNKKINISLHVIKNVMGDKIQFDTIDLLNKEEK